MGPDGALWFTMDGTSKIGSITTAGVCGTFDSTPTANSAPVGIIAGPDGALWFTENNADQIGTITTSGSVTEFRMTITPGSGTIAMTVGPDNNLWFTEEWQQGRRGDHHGRRRDRVPDSAISQPIDITAGPDGALWFTEIRWVLRSGVSQPLASLRNSPIPTTHAAAAGITVGADGALWFTECGRARANGSIVRIIQD